MKNAMTYTHTKFFERLRQASRWFVLLLLACLAGGVAQAQTLSFTPGMVTALTSADGTGSTDPKYTGPLSSLSLTQPQALTFDSHGDLFIVDAGANVVRVVASGKGPIPSLPSVTSPVAGTVYTVAGGGSNTPSSSKLCAADQRSAADNSFYGNNCAATDAVLFLYTANGFGNNQICSNGCAQVVAPLGQVALDPSGNLYIADAGDNQVRVVYAGGTVPGLLASLPTGVTPTPGNIYAFTPGPINQQLGTIIPGNSQNLPPIGVAIDASGDVYILFLDPGAYGNFWSNLAVVYNGGSLPPLLAGETLTVGQFANRLLPLNVEQIGPPWSGPNAMAMDSSGNIYISDGASGHNSVYVIYAAGTVPGLLKTLQGAAPVVGNAYLVANDGNFGALTETGYNNPTQLTFDNAGDLYVGLYTYIRAWGFMAKIDPSYNLTLVAGNVNYDPNSGNQAICPGAVDIFGDRCTANQTAIAGPFGVASAQDGSIYYDDADANIAFFPLHKIDGSASALQFATQSAGVASAAQTVTVSNVDAQPLNIGAFNVPNNFIQVASGGTDCSAPVTLTPGQSCQVAVEFQAVQAGTFSGNVTITSDSTNAASGVNSIAVSGTATATTGASAQTIAFTAPTTAIYGQAITLNGTASSGLAVLYQVTSGPGVMTGNTLTVTGVGNIVVTAYQPGNATYAAATPSAPATINAQPALLTVKANDISQARTLPIPALTYTITDTANGVASTAPASLTTGAPTLTTTATASSPAGPYPITIAQNTLSTTSPNYSLTAASFVNGTFTILPGSPQTIAFTQTLPTVTYGAASIDLTGTATATSGLPVVYTATGPATTSGVNGAILTVTGAGTVTVIANQPGNSTYAVAPQVTQPFQVNPATLTLTANNLTMAQGSTPPSLTYTVGGLVSPDTAGSVVSGTPTLATTATSSSPVDTYPITITQGSVAVSSNYTLTSTSFVSGTMSVVVGTPQTITFGALPNVTYGVAPSILNATASSGLPVTFAVTSGPASITGGVLSVTGAGTVVVTAHQSGGSIYSPAPSLSQSFAVAQATLSIAANSMTIVDNITIPPLTFNVNGLVNGDTPSVLSGTPALSTTATAGSAPGPYPINVGPLDNFGNPITATSYTINAFVPGTLTITSGGPVPDFTPSLSTPTLTIQDGHVGQATLTVTPVNYYSGTLNLSCTGLPANVSCVFSPSPLSVPLKLTTTLTISTSNAAIVGALRQSGNTIYSAAIAGWASLFFGLVLAWQRKRLARYKTIWGIAMAVCLGGLAASLTACGGSSSTAINGDAAPGTTTIQIVAADANGGPTHSIPLVITIH